MRISIKINSKATTISVDDTLIDYLGAWLVADAPKYHGRARHQQVRAKNFIREHILSSPALPGKDISQFVQRRIIQLIAAEGLGAIIDKRGPRYKKEKFDIATLFGGDREAAEQAMQRVGGTLKPLTS